MRIAKEDAIPAMECLQVSDGVRYAELAVGDEQPNGIRGRKVMHRECRSIRDRREREVNVVTAFAPLERAFHGSNSNISIASVVTNVAPSMYRNCPRGGMSKLRFTAARLPRY